MTMTFLLATGDENLDMWLTEVLQTLGTVEDTVDIRSHLVKKWETKRSQVVIISDQLPGDFGGEDKRDSEMVENIERLRLLSDTVRIVYLCHREPGDPLLEELIRRGVWDIFHEGFFTPEQMLSMLENPPSYKRVVNLIQSQSPFYMRKPNQTLLSAKKESKEITRGKESKHRIRQFVSFSPQFIVVTGLLPSTGTTFVTANFARFLADNDLPVAVYEPVTGNQNLFYFLNGEKLAPDHWVSWAHQIQQNRTIRKETNWYRYGVKWIPAGNVPLQREWTSEDDHMLLRWVKQTPLVLADYSEVDENKQGRSLLAEADRVWVVTDCDPLKINRGKDRLQQLYHQTGQKLSIIINRWLPSISREEIKPFCQVWHQDHLRNIPVLAYIPELGEKAIRISWDGNMAWDDTHLKKQLLKHFKSLAANILPEHVVKSMPSVNPGKSLFSVIFKRR